MMAALDRGAVDITRTASFFLIDAALKGSDGVAIASETATPIYSLIVKPEIKTFADGIAPAKNLIEGQPDVVKRAHDLGLTVTAYTFRSANAGPFPNVRAEMSHFLHTLGIDAAFTDNPDQFPR